MSIERRINKEQQLRKVCIAVVCVVLSIFVSLWMSAGIGGPIIAWFVISCPLIWPIAHLMVWLLGDKFISACVSWRENNVLPNVRRPSDGEFILSILCGVVSGSILIGELYYLYKGWVKLDGDNVFIISMSLPYLIISVIILMLEWIYLCNCKTCSKLKKEYENTELIDNELRIILKDYYDDYDTVDDQEDWVESGVLL